MDSEITAGFFSLAGVALGGLVSYCTTRLDQRWSKARRHICKLCDEVSAYHQLEKIYLEELTKSPSEMRHRNTIMDEMRTRVDEGGDYIRPTMTSLAAKRMKAEWE